MGNRLDAVKDKEGGGGRWEGVSKGKGYMYTYG